MTAGDGDRTDIIMCSVLAVTALVNLTVKLTVSNGQLMLNQEQHRYSCSQCRSSELHKP